MVCAALLIFLRRKKDMSLRWCEGSKPADGSLAGMAQIFKRLGRGWDRGTGRPGARSESVSRTLTFMDGDVRHRDASAIISSRQFYEHLIWKYRARC